MASVGRVGRDRVLAAVCTLGQLANARPGRGGDVSGVAAAAANAAALAGGLALLGRRRAPLAVLAATVAAYVVQAAVAGPVAPVAVLAACYTAARLGPVVRGAVSGGAAALAVALVLVAIGSGDIAANYALLLLLAVLAGAVLATGEARRQAATRDAVAEERLRIARDLHDVVGQGLGAITVQAGAGRMALAAGSRDDVLGALTSIERASRDVLRDVRWLVGLLHDHPGPPTLKDLPGLADAARRAGLTVDLATTGALHQLPKAVDEGAYRIVQESLSNVLRHSGCDRATVRVHAADTVEVVVLDEGAGSPDGGTGNGIRGMRERVDALGGTLRAGPRDDGPGWRVAATLPATRGRR